MLLYNVLCILRDIIIRGETNLNFNILYINERINKYILWPKGPNVFCGLDSRTELADWTCGLDWASFEILHTHTNSP